MLNFGEMKRRSLCPENLQYGTPTSLAEEFRLIFGRFHACERMMHWPRRIMRARGKRKNDASYQLKSKNFSYVQYHTYNSRRVVVVDKRKHHSLGSVIHFRLGYRYGGTSSSPVHRLLPNATAKKNNTDSFFGGCAFSYASFLSLSLSLASLFGPMSAPGSSTMFDRLSAGEEIEAFTEHPGKVGVPEDDRSDWSDQIIDTSCLGCLDVPLSVVALNACCLPFYIFPCCLGCFVLKERQHAAVLYFGRYRGSVQTPGVHFLPPLGLEIRGISTATRTMDMKNLKVVDSRGNPVIVSAVVTFVATSARKARIDVNNPWPNASWNPNVTSGTFLQLQAQAVLKQVTSLFPYESPAGLPSLQTEGAHITAMLVEKLQERVNVTGAKIMSFDLVDLSYAPEIAQCMLLRQQAVALVDARKLIVDAAVDMTDTAIVNLQAKRRARLGEATPLRLETEERICTNLLTVICSNEAVKPMVSMGSDKSEEETEAMASLTKGIHALTQTIAAQRAS